MAERFPSLDEFDTGATDGPALTSNDADPDADFLARERALLGDDANLFASPTDNAATVEDGDDDLLGGGYTDGGAHGSSGNMGGFEDDMGGFESSFPSLQSGNEVGHSVFMVNTRYQTGGPTSASTNRSLKGVAGARPLLAASHYQEKM
ncbi:hypothetical protein LTR28_006059 [Elasticomyces elasticus]|nr:hypothetical protein LTR28_006059 [Elasticomyces elasticus]